MRCAVVVGAGLAGLAAASSLRDHGWWVTVLERADRAREVGAGISLTPNGQAALAALGALDEALAAGGRTDAGVITDHRGRTLLPMASTDGADIIGIHRRRLHQVLLDRAGLPLRARTGVLSVDPGTPGGAPAIVRTADGELEADLVVGADGLRSVVREAVAPGAALAYSGHTCWRGVSPVVLPRFVMAWGAGEVGALRIAPQETYWYVYVPAQAGGRAADETPPRTEQQAARAALRGWPAGMDRVVAATDPEQVLRHDVYRLARPLPTFTRGRVVLIGDAAHAMLPTLGQGANSSLEDAASLGPMLTGTDLADGLARFDTERRPRTQKIAAASEQAARVGAHLQGRPVRSLRNSLLRLVPSSGAQRGTGWMTEWTAPVAPGSV